MKALVNGINLAYDDSGSGIPVVLLHGFPLDRRMWHPQIMALSAAGCRVIVPDMRGFGESDAPDGPYSMELFADDVVALLDHLGIERAAVGGMSMGGYVLFSLLERYPERINAACFIVTRSGADDEAGKERRLILARDVMKFGPQLVADAFAQVLFAAGTAQERPKLVAEVCRWMADNHSRGLAGGLLAMRERKDYTPLLGSFRLPALVIGADQDQAIPVANARALAEALPQATLCIVPAAGHLANLEDPKAFNACLIDFLRGLPAR